MYTHTHTHTHTHRNRSFQPILLLLLAAIFFTACKKENISNDSDQQMQTMSAQANSQLTQSLDNYYDIMSAIHNGGQSTATFSVDSFVFYTEATYNYKSVVLDHSNNLYHHNFLVTVPLNASKKVTAAAASTAFYAIKDSIMALYNAYSLSERISHFDVSLERKPGGGWIEISIAASIPHINWFDRECDTLEVGPDSLAYAANGGNNSTPWTYDSKGKALLNLTTKDKDLIDTTSPGAAQRIRDIGVKRYTGRCEPYYCVFYTDIETTISDDTYGSTYNFPSIAGLPNSQYKDLGITTFEGNEDIWQMELFYDGPTVSSGINDVDSNFKLYTTVPMINFYAKRVPVQIAANQPSGKMFYDFNIAHQTCMCLELEENLTYNRFTKPHNHLYYISYGVATQRICDDLIQIADL